MKKNKQEKGITLIALIITIVILLILAVVTVASIQNDEMLGHAADAGSAYNKAQKDEVETLGQHKETLNKYTPSQEEVATVKNKIINETSNTEVVDKYGNKIIVPAGFKIRVDDTTNNADVVTKGIVVEDKIGNQFVWIPVGNVYTNVNRDAYETIEISRYIFASDGIAKVQGDAVIDSYYKELKTSEYKNATARNLGDFLTSAKQKCGYYIGRYEAGNLSNTVVCKEGQTIYNYITQSTASSLAQGMYADGYSSGTFSSDLINSYAWDTAIAFIQKFSTELDASNYSNLNKSTNFTTTGTNKDEYCNINDMSGNVSEWSTETYSNGGTSPNVSRGGYFGAYSGTTSRYTKYRNYLGENYSSSNVGFRPILYVGL